MSITWHTPIIIFLFTLLQKKKDILNCSCRPCLEVINQVLDLLQTKTAFILIFLKYKGWQIEIDSKVSREQLITDVMQFWGFWKIASAKHVDFSSTLNPIIRQHYLEFSNDPLLYWIMFCQFLVKWPNNLAIFPLPSSLNRVIHI